MKLSLLILLIVLFPVFLPAQTTWEVPSDRAAKLSSTEFTDQNRSAGKDIYQANCKSCHGDPGQHNSIKLVPLPPDPASPQMQQNSDGALHYKISEGRVTMPSFKNVLSSADIWNVIAFIRSFNSDYKQQLEVRPKFAGEQFDKVTIRLSWDQVKNQVVAALSGERGTVSKPVSGLEIKLFAKRYFGNLVVDKPVTTDAMGKAFFTFPKNLPGDPSGKVTVMAQLSNEDLFGLVKTEAILTIGVPTDKPPLNEPRALWNVVQKTPVWLLFTYVLTVLGVWGFIAVVLLKLREIYRNGSRE